MLGCLQEQRGNSTNYQKTRPCLLLATASDKGENYNTLRMLLNIVKNKLQWCHLNDCWLRLQTKAALWIFPLTEFFRLLQVHLLLNRDPRSICKMLSMSYHLVMFIVSLSGFAYCICIYCLCDYRMSSITFCLTLLTIIMRIILTTISESLLSA